MNMTTEQFAELFKKTFEEGLLKVSFERDTYLGDTDLTISITDKDGKEIVSEVVYLP